jgi:hypothetical protein
VKVWDARTGTLQLELKGHTSLVSSVVFSPDGTRIVTCDFAAAKVWDARTGQELTSEPIPPIIAHKEISPDGRFIAHPVGSLVELVPLQPDEEEVAELFFIHVEARYSSERFIPRWAAAPFGPPTTQPVSRRAATMCSRSASASVTTNSGRLRSLGGRRLQIAGRNLERRPRREDNRAFDDVLELADVARPGVAHQGVHAGTG